MTSVPCPLCGVLAKHPLWPTTRNTPWSVECACSDLGYCMHHQMSDEDPPKRPAQEEMDARAKKAFEERVEEFKATEAKFKLAREVIADLVERFSEYQCDESCGEFWPKCECEDGEWYRKARRLLSELK